MNTWTRWYWIARAVGTENLPRRILQTCKKRLGILGRRLPGGELPPQQLRQRFREGYDPEAALETWRQRASKFFPGPSVIDEVKPALVNLVDDTVWHDRVHSVVTNLQTGRMQMFSRFFADLGWPIQFNRDAINDVNWPAGRHWSDYDAFDPNLSDNKCVWEASRFSNAYLLARDHVHSGHTLPAKLFWQMFDAWDEQNPYGLTAQWSCGQEGSFRAMAWIFAAITLLDSPETDAKHLHRLTELIFYTGRHVEGNINYARSQKNNHAISEAVLLWTIGLLFPELKDAPTWLERGRRILAAEVHRQVYEDGSYVQHSLNYHRVIMDTLLWAARLSDLNDAPLPDIVIDRMQRVLDWLLEMIDPATGRVPNYGANDGSLVLPLSCCDYLDYRPIAQATAFLLHGRRHFDAGPWDEKALWLFGPQILDAPVERAPRASSHAAPIGGYYILRGDNTWAMTRCHSYRDRPSQADMLHVDLWRGGENVLRDAGSYRYFCAAPWQHYFLSTAAHNTVEIDREDQMTKGPRFLWFRWTRAKTRRFMTAANGRVGYFEGEHYGYTRLPGRIVHRRTLCRIDDTYLIVDDLLGGDEHDIRLRWRLHPSTWRREGDAHHAIIAGCGVTVGLYVPPGFGIRLACGEDHATPEGWESLYYGEKTPAATLIAAGRASLPVRLVTLVGDTDAMPALEGGPIGLEPGSAITLVGIADDLAQPLSECSGAQVLVKA